MLNRLRLFINFIPLIYQKFKKKCLWQWDISQRWLLRWVNCKNALPQRSEEAIYVPADDLAMLFSALSAIYDFNAKDRDTYSAWVVNFSGKVSF